MNNPTKVIIDSISNSKKKPPLLLKNKNPKKMLGMCLKFGIILQEIRMTLMIIGLCATTMRKTMLVRMILMKALKQVIDSLYFNYVIFCIILYLCIIS
ncbi:hypothetical protein PanWU01x14_235920 [Parasponia andersonii]|uniref:Transmembrane protein n=1 Tax=Parasponia andersonii TaxID=3476 RepID=A0A2P5BIL7_PARAD|nr:hypothetical protein PanWU01x14_235920 [Parasponia andersonii]